ncbi:type II secretion system F family protein [Mariluticola halotolerans]|uniref:type II secretion system F family protein n=1 Tax=Mariluticola halotolerans TaxID=2909283 RepID=UPI0026E2F8B0|nr:type II secretion system F family protein [Mariluticola halotolerans]UJQ93160.1 type II secretion system F family protein [Mariluticola halotolerans]
MSPILLALLAFISIGALGVAFVPSVLGSGRADKRRKALQGNYQENRVGIVAERTREDRRKSVQEALKQQTDALKKRKKSVSLQARIYQAGLKIKRGAFIRNAVILGIVVFVVCFILGVPLLFSLIFGCAGAYVAPMWFLGFRRKRYQNKFLDELPNAVDAIVRGIKSGMPLNDSIRLVAREIKEPVRSEFNRVIEQQSIGKSMMEAVTVLYDRVPLPEVNFFVVVITVQQQAGGNLSEALGNLSGVLRNRKKMKSKIQAMSSEAKASAMIIGALPFIVAVLVSLASPGYLTPLFASTLGHLWLGIGALMMFIGGFIMNRMIQFDI